MKNQNAQTNMIVSIVVAVISLGVSIWLVMSKPEPVQPTPPLPIPAVKVERPAGLVATSKGLPAGGTNGTSGGGDAWDTMADGGGAGGGGGSELSVPTGAGGGGGGGIPNSKRLSAQTN